MPVPVLLGIDLGTSSAKAVVVDAQGRVRGHGRAVYGDPPLPLGAEIDPRIWREAVARAVRAATASPDLRVEGVGLSGQMHGLTCIDADGEVIRPAITWADRRGAGVLAEVSRLSRPYLDDLVNANAPGFTSTLLYWLRRYEPAHAARVATALVPKDWLGFSLTGERATERSDASATGLWDLASGGWHGRFVRDLGWRGDVLCPAGDGWSRRGELRAQWAVEAGIPRATPVALGFADVAASHLGMGAAGPGRTTLTLGTGAQLCQFVAGGPKHDPSGLLELAAHRSGEYYVMAGLFSGGLTLEWVRSLWGLSWPEFLDRALAGDEARASDPIFVPFLAGEPALADVAATGGAWRGLRTEHSVSDLLRAGVDGCLYGIRMALGRLVADRRTGAVASILVGGGGMRDSRLRQRLADVVGLPILSTGVFDTSVRGAALSAAMVAGWCSSPREVEDAFALTPFEVHPRADRRAYHDGMFSRFLEEVSRNGRQPS